MLNWTRNEESDYVTPNKFKILRNTEALLWVLEVPDVEGEDSELVGAFPTLTRAKEVAELFYEERRLRERLERNPITVAIESLERELRQARAMLKKWAESFARHPANAFEWIGSVTEDAARDELLPKVVELLKAGEAPSVLKDKLKERLDQEFQGGSFNGSSIGYVLMRDARQRVLMELIRQWPMRGVYDWEVEVPQLEAELAAVGEQINEALSAEEGA